MKMEIDMKVSFVKEICMGKENLSRQMEVAMLENLKMINDMAKAYT